LHKSKIERSNARTSRIPRPITSSKKRVAHDARARARSDIARRRASSTPHISTATTMRATTTTRAMTGARSNARANERCRPRRGATTRLDARRRDERSRSIRFDSMSTTRGDAMTRSGPRDDARERRRRARTRGGGRRGRDARAGGREAGGTRMED
jgi:hypothetical protein